jgi:hypothetical protein
LLLTFTSQTNIIRVCFCLPSEVLFLVRVNLPSYLPTSKAINVYSKTSVYLCYFLAIIPISKSAWSHFIY